MMAEEDVDDLMENFLRSRGHKVDTEDWIVDYNKYCCPDCGAVHAKKQDECTVCGWRHNPV